jgi:ribosomal protein S18 acetylase RimI-like enzyme
LVDAEQIEIRDAKPSDIERAAQLYLELRDHHAKIQPQNPRYLVPDAAWNEIVGKAIASEDVVMKLAVTSGGEIAGLVKLSIAEKPWGLSCEVDSLIVAEARRGEKIGTLLMEAAAEVGRSRGAKGIRAQVLIGNDDAFRFYEKIGFAPNSIRYGKAL